jgi:uncharacterized protein YbjT (DUF2867 family)
VTAVLVAGATGGIGRLVVEEAIRHGYRTRALVRDRDTARVLPADVEVVVGDVTRPDTLPAAVKGIDAVVFTLGSHGGKAEAEAVVGGVRNVLNALGSQTARIALMTAIGVTNRTGLATAGMVELPVEALGPQLARFLPDSWDQEVSRAQGGR